MTFCTDASNDPACSHAGQRPWSADASRGHAPTWGAKRLARVQLCKLTKVGQSRKVRSHVIPPHRARPHEACRATGLWHEEEGRSPSLVRRLMRHRSSPWSVSQSVRQSGSRPHNVNASRPTRKNSTVERASRTRLESPGGATTPRRAQDRGMRSGREKARRRLGRPSRVRRNSPIEHFAACSVQFSRCGRSVFVTRAVHVSRLFTVHVLHHDLHAQKFNG